MAGKSALEKLISEALVYAWSRGRVKIDDLWDRVRNDTRFAQALNAFNAVKLAGVQGNLYEPKRVYEEYIKQRLRNGVGRATMTVVTKGGQRVNLRKFGSYPDTTRGYVYVAMRVMTEAELATEMAVKHQRMETERAQRDFRGVLIALMREAKAQTADSIWDEAVKTFQETWA